MKSLLLCLLLLLTWVDDALARATPEPEDDVLAAMNDEYVVLPSSGQPGRPQREPWPAAPGSVGLARPFLNPSSRLRGATGALPRPDPDLLCLLMSFRC